MPIEVPDPESLPFTSLLAGYRTQITAGLAVVFNFLDVFDLVHLTDKQITAINGMLFSLAGIFLALKVARVHKSVSAAAETSSATAQAVGAASTPDPAPAPKAP